MIYEIAKVLKDVLNPLVIFTFGSLIFSLLINLAMRIERRKEEKKAMAAMKEYEREESEREPRIYYPKPRRWRSKRKFPTR